MDQDLTMNTFQSSNNTGGSASSPLLLTVVKSETPHPSLPTPYIKEARNGELDLNAFAGDAHVAVGRWPLIAAGQRVWLQIAGTGADGAARTIDLLTAYSLTASDANAGLDQVAKRADLSAFKDGSTITVECRVGFDQSADRNKAVVFQTVSYAIRQTPPFDIDTSEVTLGVGGMVQRKATGGTLPYTYSSSDDAVASVIASDGRVTAKKLGRATITARDASTGSASYPVTVMGPIYEEFEEFPEGYVLVPRESITTSSGHMTVTVESGAVYIHHINENLSPHYTGKGLRYQSTSMKARFDFIRPGLYLKFGLHSAWQARVLVTLIDSDGKPIESVLNPPYGANGTVWFEYRSPSRPIKGFTVESDTNGGFSMDNVSFS